MSTLTKIIQSFLSAFKSQRDIEEAYLAESTDHYDLERRMRLIDNCGNDAARYLVYGKMLPWARG